MSQIHGEESWTGTLCQELVRNTNNGRVGSVLVSETEDLRIWQIKLEPDERLPFHRHVLNYFWTVLTDGIGRSHFSDGRTVDTIYKSGDTKQLTFGPGESMVHDIQNIGYDAPLHDR